METPFETIIDKKVTYQGKEQNIKIDHQLDEEWQYTSCYRVTLGETVTTIEFSNDTSWIEHGVGRSELADFVGGLIESYAE